jgi:hypothetical protein
LDIILNTQNTKIQTLSVQKSYEYDIYQQKCDQLLKEEEIRFAGLINHMGRLVAGGFKDGISPLEDEAERRTENVHGVSPSSFNENGI